MSILSKYNTKELLHTLVGGFVKKTVNFNIEAFSTYIERAEEDIALPILSEALYDEIIDSTEPTLKRIQRNLTGSIICFALANYISVGDVVLGANGAKQTQTESEKIPTDNVLKKLINQLNKDASRDFDKALELIEASNDEIFADWKTSALYTVLKNTIITNAQEFSDILGVHINRRVFLKTKTAIIDQQTKVKSTLGAELYDAIFASDADENHTNIRNKYLKVGVGKLAFAAALPALAMNFADDEILSLFDNTSAVLSKRDKSVGTMDIDYFVRYFHQAGEQAIDDMNAYIADNPDDFPTYTPVEFYSESRGIKEIGLVTRFR